MAASKSIPSFPAPPAVPLIIGMDPAFGCCMGPWPCGCLGALGWGCSFCRVASASDCCVGAAADLARARRRTSLRCLRSSFSSTSRSLRRLVRSEVVEDNDGVFRARLTGLSGFLCLSGLFSPGAAAGRESRDLNLKRVLLRRRRSSEDSDSVDSFFTPVPTGSARCHGGTTSRRSSPSA